MPELKHEIYGRVYVLQEDLSTDSPFIKATLLNPRDNLPTTIMVGKVALSDQGGYKSKPRGEPLAKKYLPLAYSVATQMRLPEEDWEEVVSIAFELLTKAGRDYKLAGIVDNYFHEYARKRIMGGIIDHRRKEIRDREKRKVVRDGYEMFVEKVKTAEDKLIELENEYDLLGAVEQLPEGDSDIIHMHFYGGMSQQQIADHIGVTQKTVSKKINKLCQELRGILITQYKKPKKLTG